MTELGKVFLLDEDKIFLQLYEHFLTAKGYKVFTTDNPYKMMLYGREIEPDVVFMEATLPSRNQWEYLQQLEKESWIKRVPLAILSPTPLTQDSPKNIGHFLPKRMSLQKIIDIVESYCQGNKDHDVFILSDYSPTQEQELSQLRLNRNHIFMAHDLKSSKRYLSRNHPHLVVVKASPEEFETIKKELPADNIYRIDSFAEIENLVKAS